MELKLFTSFLAKIPNELLIVPYGIETKLLGHTSVKTTLLIVPYGIET